MNALLEGDHDIDCRFDGIGAARLKPEFVKKASLPYDHTPGCGEKLSSTRR